MIALSLVLCVGGDLGMVAYARHAGREDRLLGTGVRLTLAGLVEVQLVLLLYRYEDVAAHWAIPGWVVLLTGLAVVLAARNRLDRQRADSR